MLDVPHLLEESQAEGDFVSKSKTILVEQGFTAGNTIASICNCRDEISQTVVPHIERAWGEAFSLASLGAMFFAGRTALVAGLHHAPKENGRQRLVYYVLPHIAIDEHGAQGRCRRKGIPVSAACGALNLFLGRLQGGRPAAADAALDPDDIEMSLLARRLSRELPEGQPPDLLTLTLLARQAAEEDLQRALVGVLADEPVDYAVFTGVQVHLPESNQIWWGPCWAVIDGERRELVESRHPRSAPDSPEAGHGRHPAHLSPLQGSDSD